MNRNRTPRVALVAIGIGRIQRGFERYFRDLFEVMSNRLPMVLFKGDGPSVDNERVPRGLKGLSAITGRLPLKRVAAEYPQYKHDCLAYAFALLPDLVGDDFDVVHVIDPPLVYYLQRLKSLTRFRPQILFTNGCHMPPQYYPRAHIHHVAETLYQDARTAGVGTDRITLVPCGIHASRFALTSTREELRQRHDVRPDTFVILAVTAVKRSHKRVHHLIDEVSRLPGNVLLWIDGKPEDPEIPHLAAQRLGDRCRITFVRTEQVPELYGLADVFVHAALEEAFGLGLVEAASTGLPTFAHNSKHFTWLLGHTPLLVDMSTPGALAQRLEEFRTDPATHRRIARIVAEDVRSRFDWENLAEKYQTLYEQIAIAS